MIFLLRQWLFKISFEPFWTLTRRDEEWRRRWGREGEEKREGNKDGERGKKGGK